jgi:predicted metalloprotease
MLDTLTEIQQQAPSQEDSEPVAGPPKDELGRFAAAVLGDTEDTWKALFARQHQQYTEPRLVLFSDAVRSACGFASSATGPFYCPRDAKVYLDLGFFKELSERFGAPGDFGAAYVIAHEIGHHVQHLLGLIDRDTIGLDNRNAASVRVELQADCLAGVWGYHAQHDRGIIEAGDFEAGLRAAAAIGDDRLQRMSQGYTQPETWTHGSSAQRAEWLGRGLKTGDPRACDT